MIEREIVNIHACSKGEAEALAKEIASHHKPAKFDWAAKFGLQAEAVKTAAPQKPDGGIKAAQPTPKKEPLPAPSTEPEPKRDSKQKQKLASCSCGETVAQNVARFCWFNKARFGGDIYCIPCQEKVGKG
ncbi:MAG: hypothetical protein WAR41_11750 [Azonexus sp.]